MTTRRRPSRDGGEYLKAWGSTGKPAWRLLERAERARWQAWTQMPAWRDWDGTSEVPEAVAEGILAWKVASDAERAAREGRTG